MSTHGVGASVLRKEDDRYLRGRGEFVGDIQLAGTRHVAFLRSPVAPAQPQSAPALARGEVGGLRKRRILPHSRLSWLRASASVFWCRYFKDRGFKDGMPGFITAVLLAAYIFIEQSKAWEYQLELHR